MFIIITTISTVLFGTESTDEVEEMVYTIFIDNADDLMELSEKDVKENIMFEANIDMKGYDFKGIASFEGIMNDNGKTITGLTVDNSSSGDAGLILEMTGGEI